MYTKVSQWKAGWIQSTVYLMPLQTKDRVSQSPLPVLTSHTCVISWVHWNQNSQFTWTGAGQASPGENLCHSVSYQEMCSLWVTIASSISGSHVRVKILKKQTKFKQGRHGMCEPWVRAQDLLVALSTSLSPLNLPGVTPIHVKTDGVSVFLLLLRFGKCIRLGCFRC